MIAIERGRPVRPDSSTDARDTNPRNQLTRAGVGVGPRINFCAQPDIRSVPTTHLNAAVLPGIDIQGFQTAEHLFALLTVVGAAASVFLAAQIRGHRLLCARARGNR
jgi:hypothetical protein